MEGRNYASLEKVSCYASLESLSSYAALEKVNSNYGYGSGIYGGTMSENTEANGHGAVISGHAVP